MSEVNIYNEYPLQQIWYEVWVKPSRTWVKTDHYRFRHKPDIKNPTYETRIIEIVEESRVVEIIQPDE